MIYGYKRVSTRGQSRDGNSLEAQEEKLRAAGATEIYTDSCTGTKLDRPELQKLINEKLQPGDTLIVTKLDRFARSVSQASELITELINKGITVNVLNLGILSNGSVNTLMRNMLLAFAQFERDMIVERCQEGKSIAKQREDFREGRPPKFAKTQKEHALELLKTRTYKEVEALTGISKSTLIRYKREMVDKGCYEIINTGLEFKAVKKK